MNSTMELPSRNYFLTHIVMDSLLVILGVIGNIVVIVYNIFLNTDKNPTCYFVLNLAVSDLLVCAIFFPTYIVEMIKIVQGTALASDMICQISFTITGISLSLSVVNIMILTIDRYISITLPLKYPNIVTSRRVCIALILAWCAGLTNGGLLSFSTTSSGLPLLCNINLAVAMAGSVLCFFIPLMVSVVFNFKILRIVREQRRKINTQASPASDSGNTLATGLSARRHLAKQFKLFKTFIVVFGCFLFCVTPLPIIAVTDVLVCGGGCVPLEIIGTSAILAGANSVLNPFIYGVRHEEYRRALKILFSRPCSAT